jgi:hypothetical protein
MNLWRSKLLLIITVILALLVLISLFLLSGQKPSPEQKQEESTEQSQLLFNESSSEIPDPKLAIFDELVIGTSTDGDVSRIAGLKGKKETEQGIEYSFPSPLVDRDNIAVTKNGVLVFKRFITMKDVDHWETPSIIEYKEKYGDPEYEKKGSMYYGAFETLLLWGSKGIAIIGNDFTDEVKEIHIFEPMSTEQYLQLWGIDSTGYIQESPEDHSDEVAL